MEPTVPNHPESPDADAPCMAFFGFIPPATLRFDDSGAGGLKVKHIRVKLPIDRSAPVANLPAEPAREAATA